MKRNMVDFDYEYYYVHSRVEKKLGFYIHAVVFVLFQPIFLGLNLFLTPQRLWFFWPLLGWGIGLLLHYLGVFVLHRSNNFYKRLEERMIQREMESKKKG